MNCGLLRNLDNKPHQPTFHILFPKYCRRLTLEFHCGAETGCAHISYKRGQDREKLLQLELQ